MKPFDDAFRRLREIGWPIDESLVSITTTTPLTPEQCAEIARAHRREVERSNLAAFRRECEALGGVELQAMQIARDALAAARGGSHG